MGCFGRAHSTSLLFIFTAVALNFVGCSKSDKDSSGEMQFAVNDSLIDSAALFPDAQVSLCPPRGWVRAADSAQAQLAAAMNASSAPPHQLTLKNVFMDTVNIAGLMVCSVAGLQLQQDTGSFFTQLRQSLIDHYGGDNVHTDQFWRYGILVKQFLVTDSESVQFQLVCLQEQKDAIQLLYYMPKERYAGLVRKLESSIGSLKPIS